MLQSLCHLMVNSQVLEIDECMFNSPLHCSLEQVNNLREVQALRRLNPHSNIIELKEVVL